MSHHGVKLRWPPLANKGGSFDFQRTMGRDPRVKEVGG